MTNLWDDVAQILTDAKAHLLAHGRCKGKFVDHETRVCLVGALMYAQGQGMVSNGNRSYPFVEFYGHCPSYSGQACQQAHLLLYNLACPGESLFDWNDEAASDGDVFDLLDACIAEAKEKAAA